MRNKPKIMKVKIPKPPKAPKSRSPVYAPSWKQIGKGKTKSFKVKPPKVKVK